MILIAVGARTRTPCSNNFPTLLAKSVQFFLKFAIIYHSVIHHGGIKNFVLILGHILFLLTEYSILPEWSQGVIRNPSAFYFPIQRGFSGSIHTLPTDSPIVTQYASNDSFGTDDSIVVILQSRSTSLSPKHVGTLRIDFTPNCIPVN